MKWLILAIICFIQILGVIFTILPIYIMFLEKTINFGLIMVFAGGGILLVVAIKLWNLQEKQIKTKEKK